MEEVNNRINELSNQEKSFVAKDGSSYGQTQGAFAFSPRYNALQKAKKKVKEIETLHLNSNRDDDDSPQIPITILQMIDMSPSEQLLSMSNYQLPGKNFDLNILPPQQKKTSVERLSEMHKKFKQVQFNKKNLATSSTSNNLDHIKTTS